MQFSLFDSVTNPNGRLIDLPFLSFAQQYLATHTAQTNKRHGGMYSPAIYAGNVVRQDVNVSGISAIVFDFDNSLGRGNDSVCNPDYSLPDDHKDNLSGLMYAYHSTYSHSADWPKWRLILPLDRIVHPSEYIRVWNAARRLLGSDTNIDTSCTNPSRAYWLPSAPDDKLSIAFSGVSDGEVCSVDYLLDLSGDDNLAQFPVLDKHNGPHGRNDYLKSIVAAMSAAGKTIDEIITELLKADSKHNPPLFSDQTEGFKADPRTNAALFVARILQTINSTRMAQGKPPEAPTAIEVPKFGFISFPDITAELNTNPLIKGVLDKLTVSCIYGPSNVGKTFLAMDICYCVAHDRPWHSHKTKGGAVLYCAGEGTLGIKRRIAAIKKHTGIQKTKYGFYLFPSHLDFYGGQFLTEFVDAVKSLEKQTSEKIDLIIFDTLAACSIGADENSSKDMGIVTSNARQLATMLNVHVCFIHHTGKDIERGMRGSSAVNAAMDTAILIEEKAGCISVVATKQRDLKRGELLDYSLLPIDLGIDQDGDPVTSCVVVPAVKVAILTEFETLVLSLIEQELDSKVGQKGVSHLSKTRLKNMLGETLGGTWVGQGSDNKRKLNRTLQALVDKGKITTTLSEIMLVGQVGQSGTN